MTNVTDKTLETVLVSIIDKVTSGVDKAIEFGSTQLPDIVQQLIMLHTVLHAFWVLGLITYLFILHKAVIKVNKANRHSVWHQNEVTGCGVIVVGGISLIPALISLFVNVIGLLKILIAPKIWLIEYAADLVK